MRFAEPYSAKATAVPFEAALASLPARLVGVPLIPLAQPRFYAWCDLIGILLRYSRIRSHRHPTRPSPLPLTHPYRFLVMPGDAATQHTAERPGHGACRRHPRLGATRPGRHVVHTSTVRGPGFPGTPQALTTGRPGRPVRPCPDVCVDGAARRPSTSKCAPRDVASVAPARFCRCGRSGQLVGGPIRPRSNASVRPL